MPSRRLVSPKRKYTRHTGAFPVKPRQNLLNAYAKLRSSDNALLAAQNALGSCISQRVANAAASAALQTAAVTNDKNKIQNAAKIAVNHSKNNPSAPSSRSANAGFMGALSVASSSLLPVIGGMPKLQNAVNKAVNNAGNNSPAVVSAATNAAVQTLSANLSQVKENVAMIKAAQAAASATAKNGNGNKAANAAAQAAVTVANSPGATPAKIEKAANAAANAAAKGNNTPAVAAANAAAAANAGKPAAEGHKAANNKGVTPAVEATNAVAKTNLPNNKKEAVVEAVKNAAKPNNTPAEVKAVVNAAISAAVKANEAPISENKKNNAVKAAANAAANATAKNGNANKAANAAAQAAIIVAATPNSTPAKIEKAANAAANAAAKGNNTPAVAAANAAAAANAGKPAAVVNAAAKMNTKDNLNKFLNMYNQNRKKAWKKAVKIIHPNKGGNTAYFQKASNLYNKYYKHAAVAALVSENVKKPAAAIAGNNFENAHNTFRLNNFFKNHQIVGYPKNLITNVTANKSANFARRFLYSKLSAGRNKAQQIQPYGSKYANKHPWTNIIKNMNTYNLTNAQKNMIRRINIALAAQPTVTGFGGRRNAVLFNISGMSRNNAIAKQKAYLKNKYNKMPNNKPNNKPKNEPVNKNKGVKEMLAAGGYA